MRTILRNAEDGERGQALILFSFCLAMLLLCVMCVVDVGIFLHNRELAQQTADAAALAGAQDLPENPDQAEIDALHYVELNGLDPNTTTISFSCTSNTQLICLPGDGRYDTIRVTPHVSSPTFFGPILSFVGVNSCWVQGCTAHAVAAGCRGLCGPVGNAPVDAVEIIDRTGSMSDSDLANAKSGALTILQDFNPSLQRVGFGVLGPSSTSSLCTGSYSGGIGNATGSGGTWLPVQMTNNYQNTNGSLNNSSTIVKTINCLNKSSVGTDLGDPMKAATDELVANGRPDVKWGIILFTDGAANNAPTTTQTSTTVQPGLTTGWRNCSSQQAVTSSAGDNNGYESSANNSCNDDNSRATDANSGNNTNTSCTNTGKDKHRFYNYGFNLPSGSGVSNAIDGIEIKVKGYANSTSSTTFCVELSWDGGTSWTTPKSMPITSTSELTYPFGSQTDTWGHSWTTSQLSNTNFRVRLTDVANATNRTFTLDAVEARVTYTTTTTTSQTIWDGSEGPCDYAVIQANTAKAAGIEVYTIGYGLDNPAPEYCNSDDVTSPYYNWDIRDVLTTMATDANHFFDEPVGADLDSVFRAIGGTLTAGGSRLVE